MNISAAKDKLQEKGFLDLEIDARLDIFAEIERLKKEKMQSSSHTTTRNQTYKTWQTILEIVLGWPKKPAKPMPALSYLPAYTSWQKQPKF